jgi:hypothetical protein
MPFPQYLVSTFAPFERAENLAVEQVATHTPLKLSTLSFYSSPNSLRGADTPRGWAMPVDCLQFCGGLLLALGVFNA